MAGGRGCSVDCAATPRFRAVFDPDLFTGVWSDEAFSLWQTMWLSLYDEDTTSYEIVETIHDSFFLVAIIDNDYIKGDNLWQCLMEAGGVR